MFLSSPYDMRVYGTIQAMMWGDALSMDTIMYAFFHELVFLCMNEFIQKMCSSILRSV